MLHALLNDVAQRMLTANKHSQKVYLRKQLKQLDLLKGDRVLDFGCGTGLFASTVSNLGLQYSGYDVDDQFLHYASRLHKKHSFSTDLDILFAGTPFKVILANCCFHHIEDSLLHSLLLRLSTLLDTNGFFVFMDILAVENDTSFLHRAFMRLEDGQHLRLQQENRDIISQYFTIVREDVCRSNVLSIPGARFPLGNDIHLIIGSVR